MQSELVCLSIVMINNNDIMIKKSNQTNILEIKCLNSNFENNSFGFVFVWSAPSSKTENSPGGVEG